MPSIKKVTNINIPTDLAEAIDKVIKESSLGYHNRSEFTMQAIREKIYKEKKL